jgi:hypothetical protein
MVVRSELNDVDNLFMLIKTKIDDTMTDSTDRFFA